MKRQPLLFASALLLVVGAALWGVNYRLDHPPLTKADEEFRALVAGADNVQVSQWSCQMKSCFNNSLIKYESLDARQTDDLIKQIRIVTSSPATASNMPLKGITLNLSFRSGIHELSVFVLTQTATSSELSEFPAPSNQLLSSSASLWPRSFGTPLCQLHPRSHKRLNRTLDAYLPQRLRP